MCCCSSSLLLSCTNDNNNNNNVKSHNSTKLAELGVGWRGRPHLDGQLGELVLSVVRLVVGLLQLGLRVAQPAATVLEFALEAAHTHRAVSVAFADVVTVGGFRSLVVV